MASVWERFREGGFSNWLIVLLGLFGLGAAIMAIVVPLVSPKRIWALITGVLSAAITCLILTTGMAGMTWGLNQTTAALSGGSIRPGMRDRIYRQGLYESKSCVEFALGFSLLPAIGAVVGLLIASRRKSSAEPPPGGAFSNMAPPAPPSNVVVYGVLGVIPLFFAGALALHAKQAPGKELDRDSADVIDALDQVEDGEVERGCKKLEGIERLEPSAPARALPELPELVKRCVAFDLDGAESLFDPAKTTRPGFNPAEARLRLNAWKSSTLPVDADAKAKIDTLLARLSEPAREPVGLDNPFGPGTKPGRAPTIRMGGTEVNGRLPPEVIQRIVRQNFGRIRACYESALKLEPALTGQVKTRFVINREGMLSNVTTTSSDITNKPFLDCVRRTFLGLAFPQPEGGVVTVVYPINFAPPTPTGAQP